VNDAVLTQHTNPATCGVCKFNVRLARALGIPCLPLISTSKWPLVSVKFSERPDVSASDWHAYDVFLHDLPEGPRQREFVNHAVRVFAGNRVIADAIRPIRLDVIEAWCPSTIEGNPTRGSINVLTFGMAHKTSVHRAKYERLKALLDETTADYTVSVSTAVHEGSPWDETAKVADTLRAVFGDALRVLGYLGDDALAREFIGSTAVAMFFDPALRANNTTFWAAVDAGCTVITNRDAYSSPRLSGVFDINELSMFPVALRAGECWDRNVALHSWPPLLALLAPEATALKTRARYPDRQHEFPDDYTTPPAA
jgi:hypothetical protein